MHSGTRRVRVFNASTKALSVGFPGREESISTPFMLAHWSTIRPANSGPMSTRRPCGLPRERTS